MDNSCSNTWACAIRGRSRQLREPMFLWTLESPNKEKTRAWDIWRVKNFFSYLTKCSKSWWIKVKTRIPLQLMFSAKQRHAFAAPPGTMHEGHGPGNHQSAQEVNGVGRAGEVQALTHKSRLRTPAFVFPFSRRFDSFFDLFCGPIFTLWSNFYTLMLMFLYMHLYDWTNLSLSLKPTTPHYLTRNKRIFFIWNEQKWKPYRLEQSCFRNDTFLQ